MNTLPPYSVFRSLLKSLISLFFIVFPFFIYAQHISNYSIKHYTDENGLPQNSVKSIAADKAGYLWLATEAGVTRFDGQNFKLFDKESTGVISNRIVYFKKDFDNDRLYAFTDRWELIPIQNGQVSAHPVSYNSIFNCPYKVDASYDRLPSIQGQSGAVFLNFSLKTGKNRYYAISKDSVILFAGHQRYSSFFSSTNPHSFFQAGMYLFNCDQFGHFSRFDLGKVIPMTLTGDIIKDSHYPDRHLKVYWNRYNGQIFLSLYENLYKLDYANDQLRTTLVFSNFNYKGKQIESVYFDEPRERLFLGSQTQGLFIVQQQPFQPFKIPAYSDEKNYSAQVAYNAEQVLFANGDVYGSHKERTIYQNFNKYGGNISIAIDKDKNVWKMDSHHVYKFSLTGVLLEKHESIPGVTTLLIDKTNILWIGTTNGIYASKIGGSPFKPELKIRLTAVDYQGVTSLARAKDILWIGSSSGLLSFDLNTKKISRIQAFNNKYIRAFYLREGEVWIGTYGNGFYVYKDKKTTKMPLDQDGYLNNTHCIMEDINGFFWISTNKGLFQVSVDDLLQFRANKSIPVYYQYYDKEAGFNTNEFNGGCAPCGTLLKNGYIFLPSLIGPVIFNPLNIKP